MKKIRQYAMVRLTEECDQLMKVGDKHNPLLKERAFVFLGEIPNMLGHCVVVGYTSGQVFTGEHISDFRELTENEW